MGSFSGVLPPVTTPFAPDGSLALEKLAANLTAWHETGLSGYLLLGSNAEAVTLTEEEKLRILETARAHIPRDRLLLAGTGEEGKRPRLPSRERRPAWGRTPPWS
ncbi:MAG: dihydrodipicolinate synthase family protein [Candidatus Methylomirabilales bacterium]